MRVRHNQRQSVPICGSFRKAKNGWPEGGTDIHSRSNFVCDQSLHLASTATQSAKEDGGTICVHPCPSVVHSRRQTTDSHGWSQIFHRGRQI